MANRKTTTSTAVKRRWNDAHYTRLTISLPKEEATAYKAKCAKLGINFSDIPKEAISKFLREK